MTEQDEQRTKVIDAALTLGRLRELQDIEIGAPLPAWMNYPGSWGAPLSKLAGEAADLLERYESLNELSNRDMAIICKALKALVEVRKELEDYTHGVTDDSYDSSKLDAVIILLDSHLF